LDGRRIVTGSFDSTAILWDAETYKKLRTLKGHSGRVLSVALSADGRRVVTGSDDGSAIIWDGESGKMLFRLYSLNRAREWLSLTPEGKSDGSPGGTRTVAPAQTEDNRTVPQQARRPKCCAVPATLKMGKSRASSVVLSESLPSLIFQEQFWPRMAAACIRGHGRASPREAENGWAFYA